MKRAFVAAVALALGSPAAFAGSVTYEFTGTVTSSTGSYGSIASGTSVTGTYTINVGNGIAGQSLLPVSLTSNWYSQEQSGSSFSLPSNGAYVFSSTATVGTASYSTSTTPGTYNSTTYVYGYNGGASYEGFEENYSTATSATESFFNLSNSSGNPYSSSGLPVFAAATTGSGEFELISGGATTGSINYNITALTPVPLPAAAWLLLSGLGGLGLFGRPRKA